MNLKFSGKYKHQIDTLSHSEFDSSLADCLKFNLKNKRAEVIAENNTLGFVTPFVITLINTKSNLFFRLFWYGKGKLWWKHDKNLIKYEYVISLTPILISTLLIVIPLFAILIFSTDFSTNFIIRNCILFFLFIFLFGLVFSKVRVDRLIRNCMFENIRK